MTPTTSALERLGQLARALASAVYMTQITSRSARELAVALDEVLALARRAEAAEKRVSELSSALAEAADYIENTGRVGFYDEGGGDEMSRELRAVITGDA